MNIYEYIQKNLKAINSFQQRDIEWNRMGQAELEKAKDHPWFKDAIRKIKPALSRDDVRDYYNQDLYLGFLATLLWGGAHTNYVNHFRKIVSTQPNEIVNRLQGVLRILNQKPVPEDNWFGSLCWGGRNHIDGLGVSFFTKVLYFTTHIHGLKKLLILDNKMWSVAQAFRKAHNYPVKNYSVSQCRYLDYAQYCVDMYAVPNVKYADVLEAYLFEHIDEVRALTYQPESPVSNDNDNIMMDCDIDLDENMDTIDCDWKEFQPFDDLIRTGKHSRDGFCGGYCIPLNGDQFRICVIDVNRKGDYRCLIMYKWQQREDWGKGNDRWNEYPDAEYIFNEFSPNNKQFKESSDGKWINQSNVIKSYKYVKFNGNKDEAIAFMEQVVEEIKEKHKNAKTK